jgi:glycosyltransferase involved in cell wall biosynthesis
MTARPRVSVVIPCYNYGHYLPECVRGVLDQEGVEVDVLVVDDASPDGSVAIARELASADPRVRVLAHDTNRGHIATYNEGLSAVDGEYVVLLSADDLLTPGSLARSTALMQAHPEVGMVYGFSPGFRGDRMPPLRTKVTSWTVWAGPEWLDQVCRRGRNPVNTPDVVMRTSMMRELVGYDARLPHAADFMLWLRAATRGSIGRVNGVDQALYRIHGANMHLERYAGVLTDILERQRLFTILFDEDREHIPDADRLHALARRALAREALVTACEPYELGRPAGEPEEKLVALAAELHPQTKSSRLWREYERHTRRLAEGRGPVVPRRVSATVDDVVGKVRWRRWRRSGLLDKVGSL